MVHQTLIHNIDKIKWVGKHSYYTGAIDIVNWGDDIRFVHIGNFTAISINCKIILSDGNHFYNAGSTYDFPHPKFNHKENKRPFPSRGDVIIGSDVWIGQDVTIMSGVKIGDGAVIAANSHVVKDVPPYSICGGNPAKHIKYRFSSDIIERFIKLKWWEFPDNLIQEVILLLQKEPNTEILNKLEEILKDEYREKISIVSRYHEITKLYVHLLNRYPDWHGLKNYEYSDMSIQEIKEAIMKSQEYRMLNNG